jgi:putative ABC transport system permease protein
VGVADDRLLTLLGAGEAAGALHDGRIVALGRGTTDDGTIVLNPPCCRLPQRERVEAVEVDLPTAANLPIFFLSEEEVARRGLRPRPYLWLLQGDHPFTDADTRALRGAAAEAGGLSIETVRPLPPGMGALRAILLGVTGVLALITVAIAATLAAAESRPEITTLVAVGASPGTRRGVSAARAGVLAGLGGLLAVPGGLVPVFVLLATRGNPVVIPWTTLAIVAIGIPAVAASGGWVLSRAPGRPVPRPA